ncbi:hypothetical protein CUMW_256060 [Citrus unshiu]|uniref:Uncharacterized protein n=1 Tax=Citrus unshiu TaxID=55188 RepID=A0A2H5QRY6_CITUN|nr:hypothetical protein CUMW_256060 [Citrus unshiu]
MRTTLLLPLSFLLFAFIGKPLPVLGNASPDLLRVGSKYYILAAICGRGGGLTLGSRGNNKTVLLHVVQEQNILKYGSPMTFSPVNPKNGVIRESIDLNIKFEVAKTSVQSTVWKLDNLMQYWGRICAIGGVRGNPGPQTTRNWFMIEKFYGDYKLVFYPSHYKKKDLS